MSVEEEDPVVSEVNVYVSQALTRHLCVFQYPNRPACYTRDQQELLKAKVKPVQNKVELELSLPTDGDNYSNSKGESIVRRIECGINDSSYKRGVMDRQILTSKSVDMTTSRYAIGILKDGELHLVPLKKILQLHPDFSYLDKAVIGDQKMAREQEGTETEEEEEEARPVQVQIARVKSERAEAARKASYHYQQQLLHEEQWIPLECFGLQDHRADLERGHLFCSGDEQVMGLEEVGHAQFLNSVCPVNYEAVTQVALKEQIKNILLNAVVITFGQLCRLLGNNWLSDQVLQCVSVMATLVQCCWVVKSDLLYKDGCFSDFNGISCDILRSARDQVLYCFTKSRLCKRSQISGNINLPKEELLQIMEGVSTWQPGEGWEFKLEYDKTFAAQYPMIVKQQNDQWKLMCFNKTPGGKLPAWEWYIGKIDNLAANKHLVWQIGQEARLSVAVTETCDQTTPAAVPVHTVTPNATPSSVTNRLNATPSNVTNRLNATPSNATNQDKPLRGDNLVAKVKAVVDRSVIKLSTLKQSLHLQHYKVDHTDLMEALQVADIIEIDCKWSTASNKEQTRFFTRRQVGDVTDKYRPLLIEMLQSNSTVTYRELANRVQERLAEKPPRDTLLRLLKDTCVHKGTSKWTINESR